MSHYNWFNLLKLINDYQLCTTGLLLSSSYFPPIVLVFSLLILHKQYKMSFLDPVDKLLTFPSLSNEFPLWFVSSLGACINTQTQLYLFLYFECPVVIFIWLFDTHVKSYEITGLRCFEASDSTRDVRFSVLVKGLLHCRLIFFYHLSHQGKVGKFLKTLLWNVTFILFYFYFYFLYLKAHTATLITV